MIVWLERQAFFANKNLKKFCLLRAAMSMVCGYIRNIFAFRIYKVYHCVSFPF